MGLGAKYIFDILIQCIEISNVTVKQARFHEICGLSIILLILYRLKANWYYISNSKYTIGKIYDCGGVFSCFLEVVNTISFYVNPCVFFARNY